VSQVLFQSGEELAELVLIEAHLCLAERVDKVADTAAHDLSALAPVQSLFFNLVYKGLDTQRSLSANRHAFTKVVMTGDRLVSLLEALLIVSLLLDQVAFLQAESLECFLKHLLSVANRVAREADDDLAHTHDGTMSDVQSLRKDIVEEGWQDICDSALWVEH